MVLSLEAQNRFSYSLEAVAGVGLDHGPLVSFTPEFVAQFDLGSGFLVGAGAGVRLAAPCLRYIYENGLLSERKYVREWDAPLFLRLGYRGKDRLFAAFDAGYAVGLYTKYKDPDRPQTVNHIYDGFFLEPQMGWRFTPKSGVSLGFLFQRGYSEVRYMRLNEIGLSSDVLTVGNHRWISAITLRYSYLF